jgi:hypothetical protein
LCPSDSCSTWSSPGLSLSPSCPKWSRATIIGGIIVETLVPLFLLLEATLFFLSCPLRVALETPRINRIRGIIPDKPVEIQPARFANRITVNPASDIASHVEAEAEIIQPAVGMKLFGGEAIGLLRLGVLRPRRDDACIAKGVISVVGPHGLGRVGELHHVAAAAEFLYRSVHSE